MAKSRSRNGNNSTANLGFEAKLWLAADKLRSNMDAAGSVAEQKRQLREVFDAAVARAQMAFA